MKKIIYFLAGATPTVAELADIAELNTRTSAGYSLSVRNGAESASYGYGLEAVDLVAGTIPTAFNAKAVYGSISASKPAAFSLSPATAAIVGTGTKQLTPISVVGKTIDSLVASVPASGVVYASSDETKATVNASGLITGVAAGQATITATYTYATGKTITATCICTMT